jgi:hypothetical protein
MTSHFLQTSAPSIVHVDEFHEELSMAERKKREAERLRLNAAAPNKQRFFMELNKKVENIFLMELSKGIFLKP